VFTAAGASPAYEITVKETQPGLFAPRPSSGGRQYAAALFSDSPAFVVPSGAIQGVVSRRARPGDTVVLYGVGFGRVTPDVPAGEVVPAVNSLAGRVEVRIGGTPAASRTADWRRARSACTNSTSWCRVFRRGRVPLTFTLDGASGAQTLYTRSGTRAVEGGDTVLCPLRFAPDREPCPQVFQR